MEKGLGSVAAFHPGRYARDVFPYFSKQMDGVKCVECIGEVYEKDEPIFKGDAAVFEQLAAEFTMASQPDGMPTPNCVGAKISRASG